MVGGALWFLSREGERVPAPTTEPSAAASSAAPEPTASASAAPVVEKTLKGCRVAHATTRIASDVFPLSPVTARSEGDRTLVGFASARFGAEGVSVSSDLSATSLYHEDFTRPVFRVTPLGGKRFAVDHDDPRLRSVRTVPASTPFRLGINYFGIVRPGEPGSEPAVVWEGGRGVDITDPGFAKSGDRFAVTFRRGVQDPFVLFGWISERGEKESELAEVSVTGTDIGAPTVAASDDAALLLVTARERQGGPRRALAARVKTGATPSKVEPTKITDGDTVAISAATLTGGSWLVSFIDGDTGRLTVRVLSSELEPIGAPLFLTERETPISMERGAVASNGSSVTIVYRVKDGRRTDLWGVALTCQ